jgi:mono/diheme cytochrome c family protein
MSKNKKILLALAGLCVVFAVPTAATVWAADNMSVANPDSASDNDVSVMAPPGIDGAAVAEPVSMPSDPAKAAQIKRGEYLATAGDCQYCHSVPGGAPYAGGQPVQSPFGDLFTPNITPDKKYGIGTFSETDFWNVLHNGIEPGRSLLVFPKYIYPVMPYQDYNKLSRSDVDAIYAYLQSIKPVAEASRPSQMPFPFDQRAGLMAWDLLFFNKQPIQYDPSWSPQVRNGAFIVSALEHCAECHTQRNLLMATEPSRYLAGGHLLAQSWYAPDITKNAGGGIGSWSSDELFKFLHGDGDNVVGSPYGPMKAVVEESLSRLPASDVHDVVAYLQQGTPDIAPEVMPAVAQPNIKLGEGIYQQDCARCHGADGKGVGNNFPNLAGNQSVYGGSPDDAISMVLGGYESWHSNGSYMPEYGQDLTDDQIAAVINYIRTAWGNPGVADVSGDHVAGERGSASDWDSLSTGTTQASLTSNGTRMTFDDIDGKVELFGQRDNCMLNATFKGTGHTVVLVGACGDGAKTFQGSMTVDGKPYPAPLKMAEQTKDGLVTGLSLWGQLPHSGGDMFTAQIALNPASD